MKNKNTLSLGILIIGLFLITSVSANPVITDMTPANGSSTDRTNPTFSALIVGANPTMDTILQINTSGEGYVNCGSTHCTNNTVCSITSTCTLVKAIEYKWNLKATDIDGSTTTDDYVLTYEGGMATAARTITDVAVVFGAIANLVIACFAILITVALIGGLMNILNDICGVINSKIKIL